MSLHEGLIRLQEKLNDRRRKTNSTCRINVDRKSEVGDLREDELQKQHRGWKRKDSVILL